MKRVFNTEKKIYTLAILVEDVPGILSQVARLFSRKGYNIESIVSGSTDRPGTTRISIEIIGDELMIDQIAAQCRKLVGVINVKILDPNNAIRREMAIIKLAVSDRSARDEVIQLTTIFNAKVLDVDLNAITIWVFGNQQKNEALIKLLREFGVLEIAKSGTIAIERGRSTIYDDNKIQEEFNYGKNVL